MRAENDVKIQKIKKVSVAFRVIFRVLSAVIALAGIAAVVTVVLGRGGINVGSVIFRTAGLTLTHRLMLAVLTAATWSVLFTCFYHLQHLFGTYSRGEIFTRDSVNDLRRFGIAYILWGFMNFVWLVSLALSVHTAQTFPAHFDSLGVGLVVIVIAWFMDMAVDLREENDLTI